jgi:hypothetical protein
VTNVDFDKWGGYLPDGPLAMAFLDRLVERAIVLKVKGKSYRAWLAQSGPFSPASMDPFSPPATFHRRPKNSNPRPRRTLAYCRQK